MGAVKGTSFVAGEIVCDYCGKCVIWLPELIMAIFGRKGRDGLPSDSRFADRQSTRNRCTHMLRQTIRTAGRSAARLTLCGLLIVVLGATACTQTPTQPDHTAEIEALIDTLLHDEDATERRWAAAALGQYRDSMAVPALLQALRQDENNQVRAQVIIALGMIGDPEAVDDLMSALQNGDEEVRTQAARALGEIGDERSVGALQHALQTDGSPYVRQVSAWALGQVGEDSAVESLIVAMETDGASFVRRGAVTALGELRAERSTQPLIGAFGDTDTLVRWEAVKSLGNIGEPAVEPLTVTMWQDGDTAPWFAAFALEKIATPSATGQVDAYLDQQGINLEDASRNYRAGWSYQVVVLMLERHGTGEMARYFAEKDVDAFDDSAQWIIVHEATQDWYNRHA